MDNIIDLIVSNGIGVACIVYFMFRDYKFMSTLQQTLTTLEDTTNLIKDYFITMKKREGLDDVSK